MYVIETVIDITATTTGGATGYSDVVTGRLANIAYEPSTVTAFSTGVDFTITVERLGLGLWTESDVDAAKIVSPTQPIHDLVGVLRHPSTTMPATEIGGPIYLANDRVKVVIASAGSGGQGKFRVVIA